ncbi:UNVERIFIED_ORG: basic membrane protein A [Arthrobacter sp. UYCu721]
MLNVHRRAATFAVVGVTALALAACSAPPAEKAGAGKNPDYKACMVSDDGGFNDKGFSQAVYGALAEAKKSLGVTTIPLESTSENDYAPNLNQAAQQLCNSTVTVGFKLSAATKTSATQNPKLNYVTVDDSSIKLPNVKPIVFDTAQASFLAGYLAAGYSESGIVGVYGGNPIPPVQLFMDGYADGVSYYNQENGTSVRLIGWDKKSQKGLFAGTFEDIGVGKTLTKNLLDQGVDVVLPVAGPLYQGTGEALRDAGNGATMIGVDNDSYLTAPEYKDLFLSSVVKKMARAVLSTIGEDVDGKFSNKPYAGNLENDGVELAPFHDYADKLPAGLADKVEAVRKRIIDGQITVDSPNAPK